MPTEDNWKESLYLELRPIAEAIFRSEKPGNSLQPTMILNDAYLRLQKQLNLKDANRVEVLAAGAKIMRRILIDASRKRNTKKRGRDYKQANITDLQISEKNSMELLELEEALAILGKDYPRVAQMVELKFYGGFTITEIASYLNISESSVSSDWRFARAWLAQKLTSEK